jgi:hypothetical protein
MRRRAKGEGSIYRRKDGRWVGQVQNDAGERSFVYARTQRQVHERLTTIKRELQHRQRGVEGVSGTVAD